jgi:hypothetical protein
MALDRLSMATRTPVGIETISPLPPGLPPPPTSPSSAYYDLTGLTMQEALDKLTAFLPEYSWSLDDGIHHIRPRSLAQARNLPLDKPVDRFSRSFANVQAALTGVREIFQTPLGAGVGMAMGLSGSSSGFGTPERVNESRERPISVDLTNVTVRQILDAIVRRHGDISWTVEYVDANGTYPQFQLHFTGFDGWSSGTTVRIR